VGAALYSFGDVGATMSGLSGLVSLGYGNVQWPYAGLLCVQVTHVLVSAAVAVSLNWGQDAAARVRGCAPTVCDLIHRSYLCC